MYFYSILTLYDMLYVSTQMWCFALGKARILSGL